MTTTPAPTDTLTNTSAHSMPSFDRLTYATDEHIALIGLNRADKRNAFDSVMIAELSEALTQYEADDQLRCAVVFAHGDHFTAGLDLMELQDKLDDNIFEFGDAKIDPWGITGKRRQKPLVVVVHGICLTAGIELMLNADVVIASQDCHFAQLEVKRGIMPFGGATVRFVRAAGWQKAMPYLLTGEAFDANTAYELNLVSEVVEAGTQFERAMSMAKQICQSAPLGVQSLLKSAFEGVHDGEVTAFANLHGYLPALFASQDAKEGAMAMIERREPSFSGR